MTTESKNPSWLEYIDMPVEVMHKTMSPKSDSNIEPRLVKVKYLRTKTKRLTQKLSNLLF